MDKEQLKQIGWNKTIVEELKKELSKAREVSENLEEKALGMTKFNYGMFYGLLF